MSSRSDLIELLDRIKAHMGMSHKEATQFVASLCNVRFNTVQVWMSKSGADVPPGKLAVIKARLGLHELGFKKQQTRRIPA